MTGQGTAAGALDATAIGAYDYIVKPFKVDQIKNVAESVREQAGLQSKRKDKERAEPARGYVSDIALIGSSTRFVECLKVVGRVAPTDLPVLITGESGTGKEIVARAIHQRSSRAGGPFVAVNCGAIPVDLIESELFGHAKGSFTGADRERTGLWVEADGGTILLDEITETSLLFQVKLLRALQEGEIRQVGSNRSQKVNVRVIAATNRKIESEVEQGRFRQDLMYRLNAITIELPPLRERKNDIPLLAAHFLTSSKAASAGHQFSGAAMQMLENYDWPGNIRELENAVLHAASLSDDIIYPVHLPSRIQLHQRTVGIEGYSAGINGSERHEEWRTLAEMEAEYVFRVLTSTGNNKQAASRILDIDRKTLTRIILRLADQNKDADGNAA
jgi:two-component system response regulator AtoC